MALDICPNTPRVNGGLLGTGVFGNALLIGDRKGPWYWDGAAWQHSSPTPVPCCTTRPVFDPLLKKSVVLTGGVTGQPVLTWSWNGSTWSSISPALPADGGAPLLGFDEASSQLVAILGGSTSAPTSTWIFDGSQWQPSGAANSPSARTRAGLAYDPGTQQLVLFGGISAPGYQDALGDTWTWDGKAWTERHPHTNPPPGVTGLAYDPGSRQLILMDISATKKTAASGSEISMWSWVGGDWRRLSPHRLPDVGITPSLTYAPADKQLIFFESANSPQTGAEGSETWVFANDTWTRVS